MKNSTRKDWRKNKTGGKSVSHSCRNNGNCNYCTSNRIYKNKKRFQEMNDNTQSKGLTDEDIRIINKAKSILKKGDRVGVTKCPGTKRVFTFLEWDGNWMVSKSFIDEYSPINIYSINNIQVNLKE